MRRSDQPLRRKRRWSFRLPRGAVPLPELVYRDLVGMLFSMRLPILGLGLVFAALAGLVAYEYRDPWFAAIAIAAVFVTAARLALLAGYKRAQVTDIAELARWENRYAVGAYVMALLLALLNLRAFSYHYPLLHLLTVSLVFSFGAGVVSRISVRPVICVVSLLLATAPTAVGLAAHAFAPHLGPLHAELFAIEAVLVAMITGLSIQTVAHLYRSTVEHLTAKHDLASLAKHDALTGLANRLLLREHFQEGVLAAARAERRLAVHFIDLDGFKAVNDGYGHLAGDLLLQEVARRLEAMVRADDLVARLGGDEFVVLQADILRDDEAEMLARRVIRQLSAPYEIDGATMRISASVGIAMIPDLGLDLERLLACADAALYRAKRAGKAKVHFCTRDDAASTELAA